ncbi:MAG: hypothetical protein MAG451_03126 [Anaerolineales bacterium]|nr:hypothetical protein [Anaerolineales bacterium]
MQRTLLILSLVAIFGGLVACGPSSPATPQIHVEGAWSRPATAGGTGAVYVTVTNEGGAADSLLGAQSEIAEAVELHETTMENDVMRMQPVSSVEVPAGGRVTFEPGGLHVMLIGLKQDLSAGDRFEITLQFEASGSVPVEVSVR